MCSSKVVLKSVRIDKLKPHEATLPELVDKVVDDVRRRGLKYPIVVDSATYAIIDGHHRVEAFKRLGLRKIPALLIDYKSDIITLNRWYYIFDYERASCEPWSSAVEETLNKFIRRIVRKLRPGYYEVTVRHWKYITKIYHDNLLELYWLTHQAALDLPFRKIPEDQYRDAIPVIIPPLLNKGTVILVALQGRVFPPKTTRHVLHLPIPEIDYKPI